MDRVEREGIRNEETKEIVNIIRCGDMSIYDQESVTQLTGNPDYYTSRLSDQVDTSV